MPNLMLTSKEVDKLIAFLKYMSAMDTEGWPPEPRVDELPASRAKQGINTANIKAVSMATGNRHTAATSQSNSALADRGAALVKQYACTSCHALDESRRVGPGWGGLYGSKVQLSNGNTLVADKAYLAESIRQPDAKIVAGYPSHIMPSYATMLSDDQINAIIAYLHTLAGEKP